MLLLLGTGVTRSQASGNAPPLPDSGRPGWIWAPRDLVAAAVGRVRVLPRAHVDAAGRPGRLGPPDPPPKRQSPQLRPFLRLVATAEPTFRPASRSFTWGLGRVGGLEGLGAVGLRGGGCWTEGWGCWKKGGCWTKVGAPAWMVWLSKSSGDGRGGARRPRGTDSPGAVRGRIAVNRARAPYSRAGAGIAEPGS
jgi:hypothetical protein